MVLQMVRDVPLAPLTAQVGREFCEPAEPPLRHCRPPRSLAVAELLRSKLVVQEAHEPLKSPSRWVLRPVRLLRERYWRNA